jgi:hypothetical protein
MDGIDRHGGGLEPSRKLESEQEVRRLRGAERGEGSEPALALEIVEVELGRSTELTG